MVRCAETEFIGLKLQLYGIARNIYNMFLIAWNLWSGWTNDNHCVLRIWPKDWVSLSSQRSWGGKKRERKYLLALAQWLRVSRTFKLNSVVGVDELNDKRQFTNWMQSSFQLSLLDWWGTKIAYKSLRLSCSKKASNIILLEKKGFT